VRGGPPDPGGRKASVVALVVASAVGWLRTLRA